MADVTCDTASVFIHIYGIRVAFCTFPRKPRSEIFSSSTPQSVVINSTLLFVRLPQFV